MHAMHACMQFSLPSIIQKNIKAWITDYGLWIENINRKHTNPSSLSVAISSLLMHSSIHMDLIHARASDQHTHTHCTNHTSFAEHSKPSICNLNTYTHTHTYHNIPLKGKIPTYIYGRAACRGILPTWAPPLAWACRWKQNGSWASPFLSGFSLCDPFEAVCCFSPGWCVRVCVSVQVCLNVSGGELLLWLTSEKGGVEVEMEVELQLASRTVL